MTKKRSHKTPSTTRLSATVWLAGSLIMAGLAVLAGITLEGNTRISHVEFSGYYYTPEQELIASIEPSIGVMADSVNYAELSEALRALPYIDQVRISMGIRGTLNFRITERSPIALLADGSERIYIAEGGFKLPIMDGKVVDVPVLYGFSAHPMADTLKSEAFEQVEAFLTEARENEIGWATISEVAWTEREGVTALSHENGVKLVFGEGNFEEKLKHWEAFYSEIIPREGIRSFHSIDLRFRDQIVTRKS